MKQYAIINYEIKEVTNVKIKEDEGIVEYSDFYCANCVTSIDNFILGERQELIKIINKENERMNNERENRKKEVFENLATNKLNKTELTILDFLLDDEPSVLDQAIQENTLFETIKRITKNVLKYTEFNSSLLNAYMDYIH